MLTVPAPDVSALLSKFESAGFTEEEIKEISATDLSALHGDMLGSKEITAPF